MEQKLKELVDKLASAAGANLSSVVLYGSAVTGEFHEKHSNLNLLCIVGQVDLASLEKLQPAVRWWTSQGHPAPLVFTLEELRRSADVFAIELLDMKTHHRMLLGDDFFASLAVPLRYHSMQVKRELRTDWLRLRQAVLTAPGKKQALLALMTSTVSTFATLFRHALIALGEPPAHNKREAIQRVAQLAGASAAGFDAILDFREDKRKEAEIQIDETLRLYCSMVEAVTNEVDRRLDRPSA
jgi:hypothetical protein